MRQDSQMHAGREPKFIVACMLTLGRLVSNRVARLSKPCQGMVQLQPSTPYRAIPADKLNFDYKQGQELITTE